MNKAQKSKSKKPNCQNLSPKGQAHDFTSLTFEPRPKSIFIGYIYISLPSRVLHIPHQQKKKEEEERNRSRVTEKEKQSANQD